MLQRLSQALGLTGDQTPQDPANPPQRNAPSPFPTFMNFVRSRLRLRNPPPKAEVLADTFTRRLETLLPELNAQVKSCALFTLSAGTREWLETGVDLQAGETVTVIGDGRLYISRPLDVAIGPSFGLWYRLVDEAGERRIRKLPSGGAVVTAEQAGSLQLIAAVPGGFGDPQGGFDTTLPELPVTGQFNVAVMRWQDRPEVGLTKAAELDKALFGPALARLQQPVQPPAGWHYLWRLGEGEIYQANDEGCLCCHTEEDGGILQYPVTLPLTDDLAFAWDWCVQQLPSTLPEHIQPTHDYLSIAIEFDNGLDLTYMWSSDLAVDTIFQCPLPWWDQRETHWVLRNNPDELGQWLSERRNVKDDYQRAIGGPLPKKVVAVWLIANSAFQRGAGDCRYRNIQLQAQSAEPVVIH